MKKIKSFLCALLLTMCIPLQAQRLNGVSIESRGDDIVVVIDEQEMCGPTRSCFIANLNPGTYRISVYHANEMDLHPASRERIFYYKLKYEGQGVRKFTVGETYDRPDERINNNPRYRNVMDDRTFNDFLHSLKETRTDDDRQKMMDLLPRHTQFTSKQCRDIVKTYTFADAQEQVLKELYPRVVDQELFYIAIDALTFTSSKNELKDYIEHYNRRRR